MNKRMIAFLCIIALFLLTACTREQTASAASTTEADDISDVSGNVLSIKDEQELDALSQSMEEDIGLEEIDELVSIEI